MAKSLANGSFAICTRDCDVEVLEGDLQHHGDIGSTSQLIRLRAGFLAKVRDALPNKKAVTIRIYDFHNTNLIFEHNLFVCIATNLQKIQPEIWPFIVAIIDPGARSDFVRNTEAIAHTLSLKVNDMVLINGSAFKPNGSYLMGVIRYIGLVSEIGPGVYFGVELLEFDEYVKARTHEYGSFIGNYFDAEAGSGIVVPANLIELPDSNRRPAASFDKSKDYFNKLLSNTVNNVRNEFANRASTLRRSKNKADSTKRSSWNSPDCDWARRPEATMDKATALVSSSISNPNLRRDDDASDRSSSTKSSQTTNMSSSNSETTSSKIKASGSSGGAKKKTSTPSLSSLQSSVKPNIILSLEDRDLVIIDRHDIKESMENQSEVIVVDNPRSIQSNATNDVDLMDILGKGWPPLAGDTASVLNSTEKRLNGAPIKPCLVPQGGGGGGSGGASDRNKSMNIMSHLKSTKSRSTTARGDSHHGSSANSSFESNHSGTTSFRKKAPLDGHVYDNLNNEAIKSSGSPSAAAFPFEEPFCPVPLSEIPNSNLGLGSMVEVQMKDAENLHGVIQWVGLTAAGDLHSCLVGVELDEEPSDISIPVSNGSLADTRLFQCPPNRAVFVPPSKCLIDRRFNDAEQRQLAATASKATPSTSKVVDNYKMFGQKDCPVVPGFVPPLKILAPSDLEKVCGKFKGIQGHHNSCYLDATLFAMFTFTSVFDSLLFRPPDTSDIADYDEVQTVLRDEIVNPLRKNLFVRADRVLKLRKLLDRLSSVTGLMTEEKDPEEFLNSLLAQILRVEPFLKLSSGQDAFYYQLFVEKDERLRFPSVQQLFEQSFLASDIKLKEVPSCLIIQMPRFGKDYKMYPRILPSQVLDVTHIIEDSPRPCSVCSKLAYFECRDCFGTMECVDDFESTAFCQPCLERSHNATTGRHDHSPKAIAVPENFRRMNENNCIAVPRVFMELFAVVCIETSHYVAFVKAGSGQDAPWCFFDSMADRRGEVDGYNIPEMVSVGELSQWLSEDGARDLNDAISSDKMLPEHAKRLFCDAYMCIYQSTDVMMYR